MFLNSISQRACHSGFCLRLFNITSAGSLMKDLIACLRQGKGKRRPRNRGKDRIWSRPHLRRPQIQDRLMLGHWGGRLLHRYQQRLCCRYVGRANQAFSDPGESDGSTATAAAISFSDKLNEVLRSLCLSMTYEQCK